MVCEVATESEPTQMQGTVYRSPPNTTYYINNVPLEWVSEFTYLGVKITSNLSWRGHILAKTTKANRTLNLLRRTMYSGEGAKKRAYEALVRPQVEYCSAVWNPHLKKDVDVLLPHLGLGLIITNIATLHLFISPFYLFILLVYSC